MSARPAKPVPCPFCGAATRVMPALGGGWQVACQRPLFQPKPCRAVGPLREDAFAAIRDWNDGLEQAVVGTA
jgi:hypothetical protein